MARGDGGDRSTAIPYRVLNRPGARSTPEDAIRAIYDELGRISQALADYDRPVSCAVSDATALPVDDVLVLVRLFDDGDPPSWCQPGNSFNASTGVYTVSQEGLYQISLRITAAPLNAPATKSYEVVGRLTVKRVFDGSQSEALIVGGGLDDQYVTAAGDVILPLKKGDQFWFDAGAVHPQLTTTTPADCNFYVLRQSGINLAR
jgi:hypothetical protein